MPVAAPAYETISAGLQYFLSISFSPELKARTVRRLPKVSEAKFPTSAVLGSPRTNCQAVFASRTPALKTLGCEHSRMEVVGNLLHDCILSSFRVRNVSRDNLNPPRVLRNIPPAYVSEPGPTHMDNGRLLPRNCRRRACSQTSNSSLYSSLFLLDAHSELVTTSCMGKDKAKNLILVLLAHALGDLTHEHGQNANLDVAQGFQLSLA